MTGEAHFHYSLCAMPVHTFNLRHVLLANEKDSVISYSTSSACLSLAHLYPKDTNVAASVDVSLLLESLTAEQTRVGEFVNVIGYITEQKITRDTKPPCQESKQVCVQAIVLWSTGPMDLQKYEKLLDPKGSPS